jgi:hypothetical protein
MLSNGTRNPLQLFKTSDMLSALERLLMCTAILLVIAIDALVRAFLAHLDLCYDYVAELEQPQHGRESPEMILVFGPLPYSKHSAFLESKSSTKTKPLASQATV